MAPNTSHHMYWIHPMLLVEMTNAPKSSRLLIRSRHARHSTHSKYLNGVIGEIGKGRYLLH